jgi:phenylacetate-CoA ligase
VPALRRLNDLLALVTERNAFQRSRLGAPAPLQSIEELRRLPFTRKQDLLDDQRAHPPFGTNLTFGLERYGHLNQTSGTTGHTLRVLDTDDDWAWWSSGLAHHLRAAGVGPDAPVALPYSFWP